MFAFSNRLTPVTVGQHWLDMPAIDIFEAAVRPQLDQDHGRVFLHIFLADITIGHIRDFRQRLTGKQHP